MATPESQISAMKAFAQELQENELVKSAHIDDWGRFGNFTLHVTPANHDRNTTRRLQALVRKHMPSGAHLRETFPPTATRKSRWPGIKPEITYDRSFWAFDIDYQYYDRDSNTFSVVGAAW